MDLNNINEVWLALEAERARITNLFEWVVELEGRLDGKEKENSKTRPTT